MRLDSSTLLSLLFLAGACETPADKPGINPGAKPAMPVVEEQAAGPSTATTGTTAPPPSSSAELAALRRGYGAGQMQRAACLAKDGDRALKGTGCGSGFVVYGPYVTVPANSDVEVVFEIQADSKISLSTDLVSEMGKQFHAGINDQTIEAGTSRKIGYRSRFAEGTSALEARVLVRTDAPASFSITDFALTVRTAQ